MHFRTDVKLAMEQLKSDKESDKTWSLQSDKHLLKALQDLSSDLMGSMQRLEHGLSGLEDQVIRLSLRLGVADARYKELCQTQFVEQVVESSASGAPSVVPEPSRQAVDASSQTKLIHSRYKEALAVAAEGLILSPPAEPGDSIEREPLPHVFGSPEYLQDASFGIGSKPQRQSSSGPPAAPQEQAGAPGPATRNGGPGATSSSEDRMPAAATAAGLPDFRSMLEAALRGELDDAALAGPDRGFGDTAAEEAHADPKPPEFADGAGGAEQESLPPPWARKCAHDRANPALGPESGNGGSVATQSQAASTRSSGSKLGLSDEELLKDLIDDSEGLFSDEELERLDS